MQNEKQSLSELKDRVLVNHVDGSLAISELIFTYNHEHPYANGTYNVTNDLHTIEYALERSEERRGGKECRSRWAPDH